LAGDGQLKRLIRDIFCMKLKKFTRIDQYKCFKTYDWLKFFNNVEFHDRHNILYGENGCGKGSLCNILKSLSSYKKLVCNFPNKVQLAIDDHEYIYENRSWNDELPYGSILFFDREFVDINVHLGHDRGTLQGEQEQESGKLILEFDSNAINLRETRDKFKTAKDASNEKVKSFHAEHKDILAFSLDEGDTQFYETLKDKNAEEISDRKKDLEKEKKSVDKDLVSDKALQEKVSKIQTDISTIECIDDTLTLSTYSKYQSLFNYDIKKQAETEADQELLNKIKEHKKFFESGLQIRATHPNKCPFCQSTKVEDDIELVVRIYDQLFDESYKQQLNNFIDNKKTLIDELVNIEDRIRSINVNDVFLELKRLEQEYKIKGIYSVEEEKRFKVPITTSIKSLKVTLEKIEHPEQIDIRQSYEKAVSEYESVASYMKKLNEFINAKNEVIHNFKTENTDDKLAHRIDANTERLSRIKKELSFITDNKLTYQKARESKLTERDSLQKELENYQEQHRKAREKYGEYCSTEAFSKILSNIQVYFSRFHFDFVLELDTQRKGGTTKEFPFAFKVVDKNGEERDLKEGLSEGEIQVLSLCFFFAFLDIQKDNKDKIVVFDDPITSLDNCNLSSLVDLIFDVSKEFSQTFVLTHNRMCFKFLRKRFGEEAGEYNIIRNQEELGGSFICLSKPERFIGKLRDFEAHLERIAQEGLDIELKIVEYGQYLRYEIEWFIKNKLLHWDAENNFTLAIDGVKSNKGISDNDLDTIKDIYAFCNWTTSHVDIGDDHGLGQLKNKITDFIRIAG